MGSEIFLTITDRAIIKFIFLSTSPEVMEWENFRLLRIEQ